MKKALLLLFGLFLSITIINHINGKSFSVLSYIEDVSTISDLERPKLNITFKSYKELSTKTIKYVFNEGGLVQCLECGNFCTIIDGTHYVVMVPQDNGNMKEKLYTEEEFNSFSDNVKNKMVPYTTDASVVDTILYTMNFISQPFICLFDICSYVVDMIVYVTKVISILGGGLIL